MIKTSKQLKDLVGNRAHGDSAKSMLFLRNYAMERFLERLSASKYRSCFILKGGMLISAMVGIDSRATMDIDTTLQLPFELRKRRADRPADRRCGN